MIIPETQVDTQTLRGFDPNIAVSRAQGAMDRMVLSSQQLQSTIQKTALDFQQKLEKKKQQDMTYEAILPYVKQSVGGDPAQAEALAKTIARNPEAGSAVFNMLKSQEQLEIERQKIQAQAQPKAPTLPQINTQVANTLYTQNPTLTPGQLRNMPNVPPGAAIDYLRLQEEFTPGVEEPTSAEKAAELRGQGFMSTSVPPGTPGAVITEMQKLEKSLEPEPTEVDRDARNEEIIAQAIGASTPSAGGQIDLGSVQSAALELGADPSAITEYLAGQQELRTAMAPPKTDQELLSEAIAVTTDPSGRVDLARLQPIALQLGASPSVVADYVAKQQSIQEEMAPVVPSEVASVVQEHGTFAPPEVIEAMNPEDAMAYLEFKDQNAKVITDPTTGDVVLLDIKTGQTQAVDTLPEFNATLDKLNTPTPREGRALYELVDLQTTGIAAGATESLQRFTGQFPGFQFNVQNQADAEARNALQLASKELVRALRDNPRHSDSERISIEKETSIKPSVLMDPVSLRRKMVSLHRSIENRIRTETKLARSGIIAKKDKQASVKKIAIMRSFLDILGVPQNVLLGDLTDSQEEILGKLNP